MKKEKAKKVSDVGRKDAEINNAKRGHTAAFDVFWKGIREFIEQLVAERGVMKKLLGAGHNHMVGELHNFDRFSFLTDLGQSHDGGNTIKVWYHPFGGHSEKLEPVLIISWLNDPDKYHIHRRIHYEEWEKKLIEMVRRHEMTPHEAALRAEIRESRVDI